MEKNLEEPVVNFAELVLVGAGPIGLELAVILHRMNIPFIHLEARQIGHTFTWWPRNTPFFSTTERIEIAGIPIQKVNQERTTGEKYLAYLRNIVEQFDLKINTYEPVVDIHKISEGFNLQTHTQTGERYYQTHKLILAIGDMDFPNLLNIPGEDLEHVSHYFL
jgi:thioredoxin reductase (NADPH)